MVCTKCQREIAEYSNFCYYCGARQFVAQIAPGRAPKRFVRLAEGRVFGGVLTGLAAYLDVDLVLVRIVYCLVTLFTGVFPGVIGYLVCWMVVPDSSQAPAAFVPAAGTARRFYRSRNDKKLGGLCGGIGEYAGLDSTVVRLLAILVTVLTSVIPGLIAYFVCWIVIPEAPEALPAAAPAAAPQHS